MTQIITNISNSIRINELLQAKFWVASGRSNLLEVSWFFVYSIVLLAFGVFIFFYLKIIVKDNPPKQKFFGPFAWMFASLGALGIILGLFRVEGVTFFSAFAFWALHILATLCLIVFFAYRYIRFLPKKQASYESYLLKKKYLPKRKKKK
jgi:hypothetical protein